MNLLTDETSPYLRQHADNPVEWYPWGHEALQRAKDEDKPIFLSIGYASCHWCHVMAHESFEDEVTAKDLARWFISVKVDREERPDLDSLYMAATQALTGESPRAAITSSRAGVRLPMVSGSAACAVAVAISAVRAARRSARRSMLSGRSCRLRRARYCSSAWFFLSTPSRPSSTSASASVSTAGYRAVAKALPNTTLVSIGHRSALNAFHKRRIAFEPRDGAPATVVSVA